MAPNKSTSLVVIGGWLGCKPKYLKSYERLYSSLGFETLSFIASPLCVIGATLHRQDSLQIEIPPFEPWTKSSNESTDGLSPNTETKMQALAWKVLGDIDKSQAEEFIFHSFSNGGCFLWESMCKILELKDSKTCDNKTKAVLERLYGKCKGLVFDSCPAWFGQQEGSSSKLWQALHFCSQEEKDRIHAVYGDRIQTADKKMVGRNLEYFRNLATCPLDVPQLFFYSKDDDLARHEFITKIIDSRRSTRGGPIIKQVWERSVHCRHLLEHRDDYEQALKVFLQKLKVPVKARL